VYRALRVVNPSPYMVYMQVRGSLHGPHRSCFRNMLCLNAGAHR
jgi:hypothetical protein